MLRISNKKEITRNVLKIFINLGIIYKNANYYDGNITKRFKHNTLLRKLPKIDEQILTEIYFEILSVYPDVDISYLEEAETLQDIIYVINTSIEH